jgi:hypothetical protein
MTEFLTQHELMELLGEVEERVVTPVFIAPKATDRGFAGRRDAKTKFQMRIAAILKDVELTHSKIQRLSAEIGRLNEAMKATTDEAVVNTLSARIETATGHLDAAFEDALTIGETQKEIGREQIEFLLPYFKAIKYPVGESGWEYKPRPKTEGPELEAFLSELRPLVVDVSEQDLKDMMEAIAPSKDQSAVP